MLTQVKTSADEETHHGVYVSVVRLGKCNKRKKCFWCKEIEEAANMIKFQLNNTFVFSRC